MSGKSKSGQINQSIVCYLYKINPRDHCPMDKNSIVYKRSTWGTLLTSLWIAVKTPVKEERGIEKWRDREQNINAETRLASFRSKTSFLSRVQACPRKGLWRRRREGGVQQHNLR